MYYQMCEESTQSHRHPRLYPFASSSLTDGKSQWRGCPSAECSRRSCGLRVGNLNGSRYLSFQKYQIQSPYLVHWGYRERVDCSAGAHMLCVADGVLQQADVNDGPARPMRHNIGQCLYARVGQAFEFLS